MLLLFILCFLSLFHFYLKIDQLQLNYKHYTSDQNFRLNMVFLKTDFNVLIPIFNMLYYDTPKSVIIINVKLEDCHFCVRYNF